MNKGIKIIIAAALSTVIALSMTSCSLFFNEEGDFVGLSNIISAIYGEESNGDEDLITSEGIEVGILDDGQYTILGIGECTDSHLVLPGKLTSGHGMEHTIKSISSGAFSTNGAITTVTVMKGVEIIESNAFSVCTNLSDINLPSTLTAIKERAFYRCSLDSLILPSNVKYIGDFAFADNALTSVVIGDLVEYIGEGAFINNNRLTTVYYEGSEEEFNAIEIGKDAFPESVTVIFNSGEK